MDALVAVLFQATIIRALDRALVPIVGVLVVGPIILGSVAGLGMLLSLCHVGSAV
jgi:hypothetical protein